MKKICFLIGNGKSREGIDLEQLRGKGTIVGCNAIYRDFSPDVLIAIDNKMLKEIGQAGYKGYYVYPANRNPGHGCSHKIDFKNSNTSGAASMQYAGTVEADYAFLIGFDCYTGNMYENTPNYNKKFSRFEGFLKGYQHALRMYKNTKFINVIKDKRDGITKYLTIEDNYLGAADMDEFFKALPNFPEQEPLLSINFKKS